MHMQTSEALDLVAHLRNELPVAAAPVSLAERRAGLVIVDEQKGFATVGAGALAPTEPNAQITRMIEETDRLARMFVDRNLPIAMFLDYHHPDRPEPPYPPHCIAGSGEEDLVAELQWLADAPRVMQIRADCINDFVGSIDLETGRNQIVEWVNDHRLDTIIVVGICTDICVAEFVATMLSARNHGMMPTMKEVVVYEPGCATYDLPKEKAIVLGLPETAAHPQDLAHHLGLFLMASRGAYLASQIR
jgi:nicotinamidase-related amidase